MADFLFADQHKTVLIESKGSFSLAENDPTAIKSVLKSALTKQVDPWMGYLKPTPSNGHVVYSCLRETSCAPSALFVVDPDGDESNATSLPFAPDQVMRENYSAWLRAMGLSDAAARLAGAAPEGDVGAPAEVPFLVYEANGREYAFRADQIGWPDAWGWHIPASGLDLAVLRAISNALQRPSAGFADSLHDVSPQVGDRQRSASVFPDGSWFGPLDGAPSNIEALRL